MEHFKPRLDTILVYTFALQSVALLLQSLYFLADIDAAGKPPTGVLRGHTYWPVNLDQCAAIPNSHSCGSAFTIWGDELKLVCLGDEAEFLN